ncbi:hypothetical protein PBI_GRAVY_87 [Gordonia phage Gravy]|uniref:Uncharacterized protein n=4 Tax=Tanisvirus tanis TaxID=2844677 RepID=A0A7D5FLR3_9CAUD|nr:hypothetical protein HWC73_gp88 [Gordonia phage Tanis]AVO25326.1 hypothetical protein PBI_GRAVY_87 [Gordonia phage Gravy]AVO25419.1 hypothetical protein PBI_KERRY_87 [Gordonia phage Kerry]QKY78766.1 hypothetical protein SEA_GILL_88 [Gordonia phage Gill]QLF83803.1 hypothetical protein SEA_MAGEL_89 [Gordonia phage Magel]QYW00724.1 hypothetical protein SEA_RONEY_86 [Gordonia phage Roney]
MERFWVTIFGGPDAWLYAIERMLKNAKSDCQICQKR